MSLTLYYGQHSMFCPDYLPFVPNRLVVFLDYPQKN